MTRRCVTTIFRRIDECRWHWRVSRAGALSVFFQGGRVPMDSWTLRPKPLRHRHRTGPHPSGLWWTPVALESGRRCESAGCHHALELQGQLQSAAVADRRIGEAAEALQRQDGVAPGEDVDVGGDI